MHLFQEIVQGTVSIWPTNALGWISLLAAFVAMAGTIIAGIWALFKNFRKSIREEIAAFAEKAARSREHQAEKFGERIGHCEEKGAEMGGILESVRFDIQKLMYERKESDKALVELRDMIRETTRNLDKYRENAEKDINAISRAVAGMEGSVKLFIDQSLKVRGP